MRLLLVCLLLLPLAALRAEERTIVYEKGAGSYDIALLDLVLSRTPELGPYRLKDWAQVVPESRAIAELNDGGFDVTYMVLTPEREKLVLPVRVEINRGIQGYRIFLVHRENAEAFAGVKTLQDLRTRFTVGFGAQWADLGVFQSNHFRVETAVETKRLYAMLQGKRFDFFPRGINEIWDNLLQHNDVAPDMVVEPHLALYYPMVQCFVVAKTNAPLAERLKLGFERVLADGSMKALFLKFNQPFITKANIAGRRLFQLENPELPLGGPDIDTSWWLKR